MTLPLPRFAVHVVPIGDLVAHDVPGRDPDDEMPAARWGAFVAAPIAIRCSCGPDCDQLSGPNTGRRYWRYIHHALDGREQREDAS